MKAPQPHTLQFAGLSNSVWQPHRCFIPSICHSVPSVVINSEKDKSVPQQFQLDGTNFKNTDTERVTRSNNIHEKITRF